MKKIAIFASGGGSNFRAINRLVKEGDIRGEIVLLISNNPKCKAVIFAEENLIHYVIVNNVRYPDAKKRYMFMEQLCVRFKVDLICLAGYMKILPQNLVRKFENKILNIHPSLLPRFGGKGFFGMRVHEAVINSGCKISGATVHFVDEIYDHGAIIAQKKVIISDSDTALTLADKVLKVEHELYPKVVKAFCEGKIIIENNSPKILEDNED